MTCQTSTVAIGPDRQGPALLLRQFDRAGEVIYEESVQMDLVFTVMRGG
jgi:hypothetical protein